MKHNFGQFARRNNAPAIEAMARKGLIEVAGRHGFRVTKASSSFNELQFLGRNCDVKIHVKKRECVGHARCAAVAPQLFILDDDGYIAQEVIDVPPGMEDLARRGAKACPERIITIEE